MKILPETRRVHALDLIYMFVVLRPLGKIRLLVDLYSPMVWYLTLGFNFKFPCSDTGKPVLCDLSREDWNGVTQYK
jgi:hypothetical protein